MPQGELCSRSHVSVSSWMTPQMTSHLCLLILPSLAVASQLGLENVFFSPEDQTVREGEGVFFQCVSGESLPPASITWLKEGKPVKRGKKIQGEYGGGNQRKTSGTLHLLNVTLEDDGVYTCVTHNSLLNISKRSKPARLTVQGVPKRLQITLGPDNITVAIAAAVSMHCAVHGFPVPMVHWFKDGCLLTNCSASFSLHNNGQLLTFRNVTKEDEGWYHCEAFNQNESIKSEPAFLLLAEMDWSFAQHPTNLTVRRGENVTVTCRPPHSRPAALVSWFKNNHPFAPTDHVTLLQNGDLFFHSVQESDGGSYFCRASNVHLQQFLASRRATLTVLAPPSVKIWPLVLTVPVGARVVLECRVSGHPSPSISWLKRGHSKHTGGKTAVGPRNATLCIESARSYDEGVYVCVASNTLGQSRNTSVLRVAVSPVIVTFTSRVSCMVAASVDLPCRAVGILPINYTWTWGRAQAQYPISPTGDRHIDEDGTLHISNVQQNDAGEYYCTAENRAGRHQRRTILTVTAELHPADRAKQTRLILSADTFSSKDPPLFQSTHLVPEKQPKSTHMQPDKTPCSSPYCDAPAKRATAYPTFSLEAAVESTMTTRSLGHLLQDHLSQQKNNPTRALATQLQPPMLPPPPYPNFKSLHLLPQVPATNHPLLLSVSKPSKTQSLMSAVASKVLDTTVQYGLTSQFTSTSPQKQFQYEDGDKVWIESDSQGPNIRALPLAGEIPFTEMLVPQLPSKHPPGRTSAFLRLDSYSEKTTESHSITQAHPQYALHKTEYHQSLTKSQFYQSNSMSTQMFQAKLSRSAQTVHWETHNLPTLSHPYPPDPHKTFTQSSVPKLDFELTTVHYLRNTKSPPDLVTKPKQSRIHTQTVPFTHSLPPTQPQLLPTPHSQLHSPTPLPQTEIFPDHHSKPPTARPSVSPISPSDQTFNTSTKRPEIPDVHQVNISDQVPLNISKQGNSVNMTKLANDTRLTEWLKRNTSQSPMTSNDPRVTQSSRSWLPVLEKHDIPIVVGVGVSLAFIFITVSFYSVVQKNEPAPTSRAAQRSLGVPLRHAERRTGGRTYENKAFEDDDCVAVIEQSPNTADTRARPPGTGLVTVHMEPTFQDLQEDSLPAPDTHSVTVETYPEPILDTKIDASLEEEKGCSLSQPSVQLQCSEDWTSNRGDNRSSCQDALPPPSPLRSQSPCPSPPSRLEEGLRSSLTLQSGEACAAPIHHSLSVSHSNTPLLLSHHVSLGLTTVAVDVHFYPAATVSMAVGTSTHINSMANSTPLSAPLFSPPLVNNQESHHQSK